MNYSSTASFAFLPGSVLLLVVLLAGPPEARAQTLFGVQYDEDTLQRMTETERPLTSKALSSVLAREGHLVYKGKRPARARFVVLFAGTKGKMLERAASEPFTLEPGRHATSEHFPGGTWRALFNKAFPGGTWFPLDTYAPKDARWDEKRGIINGIYDRLKRNQVGLVLALVPASRREQGEAQIRPLELVLRAAR